MVNPTIKAARRVLGSSSTSLMSQYLNLVCPDRWDIGVGKGGLNKDGSMKAPVWPESTVPQQGSDGVANYVAATDFAIGYLDAGHGHKLGMNEIKLQNKDGMYLTSKEANIAGAANSATLPASDGDWSAVSLLDQAGDNTWPITTFSYLYLRKDLTPLGSAGGVLRAFMQYVLSEEGQALVADYGFEPVSQKVLDLNAAAMSQLRFDPKAPMWDFELAGTTRPLDGASLYTFSGKRRDTDLYQIASLEAKMAKMEETIAKMAMSTPSQSSKPAAASAARPTAPDASVTEKKQAAAIASLRSEVSSLSARAAAAPHDDSGHDDETDAIGIVALIISIVALILGGVGAATAFGNKKGLAAVQLQQSPPKTAAGMA